MNLYTITHLYCQDDPEFMGDAALVTLTLDGKELLSGDWYHDKIDDQIKGYLQAVADLSGREPNVTKTQQTSDEY